MEVVIMNMGYGASGPKEAQSDSEQMKKGLKEGLIPQWYTGRDSGFAKANPQRWASPR